MNRNAIDHLKTIVIVIDIGTKTFHFTGLMDCRYHRRTGR